MEEKKKVFCCPLRCVYHGERRPDGTFCDSTYGGKEQEFCMGENYCKIADTFKKMQERLDAAEAKLKTLSTPPETTT